MKETSKSIEEYVLSHLAFIFDYDEKEISPKTTLSQLFENLSRHNYYNYYENEVRPYDEFKDFISNVNKKFFIKMEDDVKIWTIQDIIDRIKKHLGIKDEI